MKRILFFLMLILSVFAGCSGDDGANGFTIPVDQNSGSGNDGSGSGSGGGNGSGSGQGSGGGTPADDPAARLKRIGQTPVVCVYLTEYTPKDVFPSAQEVRCFTHINYGHGRFVNKTTGDGGIEIAKPEYLKQLIGYKSSYPELKVLLMIGGWGKNADGFSMMARDPDKRKLFVSECVRICNEYGVDGFDIDWEYPTYPADGNGASKDDYTNFVLMFKEMREAMPDRILSYAASDSGKYTDNYGVLPYVDYINVMTYSMGDPPYHNSPLYWSSLTKTRSGDQSIGIFRSQGVPYDRMNFGIGFYGHGDGSVYPSSVKYADIAGIFDNGTCDGKNVSGYNLRCWDDVGKNVYLGDASGRMYASYEDPESISYRVRYLKEKGMLGAFAWEYREDNAAGTLRHALRDLMDGKDVTNPYPGNGPATIEGGGDNGGSGSGSGSGDDPGTAAEPPVMGKVEFSKKLESGTAIVEELSGLCLSKDGDFLWGVGDNGALYKINFDGSFTQHWTYDADMEGLCMDPATGTMYMGIEPKRVYSLVSPYTSKTTLWDVAEAAEMGNSGIEGIAWHKGNLYLGAQTGATLWEYKLDGTKLSKKSLRTVTPTISEIAGLDYDEKNDWLWVIDSNSNKDRPEYLGYTVYLFDGDATKLLATYYVGDFANWNPESICVDRKNGCIWIADDCGDATPSILHKVLFTGL